MSTSILSLRQPAWTDRLRDDEVRGAVPLSGTDRRRRVLAAGEQAARTDHNDASRRSAEQLAARDAGSVFRVTHRLLVIEA